MMSSSLIGILRLYQMAVSPFLPGRCRFLPTCSQYAIDAIQARGAVRGAWLGFTRFLRCNPLFPGGYDPAPDE